MAHDLLAELAGYQNELDTETRRGRADRAASVAVQMQRVRDQISDRIDALRAEAADYVEAGQDAKAAVAAVEARRLERALHAAPQPATPDGQGDGQAAAEDSQDEDQGDGQADGQPATPDGQGDGDDQADAAAEPPAAETRPRRTARRKGNG